MNNSEVARVFRKYYFSEMNSETFEKWLYSCPGLEEALGQELYIDLVSQNFGSFASKEVEKEVLLQAYQCLRETDIRKDRTIDILRAMLDGVVSIKDGCGKLWNLQREGVDFIPLVFVGYASEFDEGVPESFHREDVLADCRKLLDSLVE